MDLAEPAGGQKLRQLGAADADGRRRRARRARRGGARGRASAVAATPSAPAPTSTCSNSEFLATTTKSIEIAQVSARTYDRIYNLSKPTIAVVEGYAVAGGFELFISCDFAVVAEEAKIGDFHIRRALFGGAGPIYRLPRYVGMRKAKELMLTGKLLSGRECYEWGLANAVAPAAELEQAAATSADR